MIRPGSTIILDVGGVLYFDEPFENAWLRLIYEEVASHGVALSDFFPREPRPRSPHWVHALLRRRLGHEGEHLAKYCWELVRSAWLSLVQPVPDAVSALALIASHATVIIVANQPPECLEALHDLGVLDYVEYVALDSVAGYTKPDPRLLYHALAMANHAVAVEDIVVVGDRVDTDIVMAKIVGASAVLLDSVSPPLTPRRMDRFDVALADWRARSSAVATSVPDGVSRAGSLVEWTLASLGALRSARGEPHPTPTTDAWRATDRPAT